MDLTGTPLLVTAVIAMVAAAAATVAVWPLRRRRLRLPARVLGVLLCEVSVVAAAGLVLNRVEEFYPSWAALAGHTGGNATTQPRHQGALDGGLVGRLGTGPATGIAWQPANAQSWRLGGPARLVVPDDYLRRTSLAYPATLVLADGPAAAALAEQALTTTTDVVGVVVSPTRRTTAGALASELPTRLGHDLRVTGHGWILLASAAQAGLARDMIRAAPDRFGTLAVIATHPTSTPPDHGGTAASTSAAPTPGVTFTGTPTVAWTKATAWAARLTPLPLSAPLALPTAASPR